MSSAPDDPRDELLAITSALGAQLEWLRASGATGLPRASAELASERARTDVLPSSTAAAEASERVEAPLRREEPAETLPVPAQSAPPPVAAELRSPARHREPERAASRNERALPVAVPTDAGERRARLAVLASEVSTCTRCALHTTRTQTVFARGDGSSGVCFVGEGPGQDEDLQGYPFVGKAGQLLDKMIEAMGFSRDDVYVCNIVKCRPPNNRKPEPAEIEACSPFLTEQLALVAPEVIVALGSTAVQGMFGTSEGITRLRGRWKLYKGRIAVMPTFHPAYLLRTPSAKRDVWQDLQAVLKHLGRAIPPPRGG
jgi:DNA polymerase